MLSEINFDFKIIVLTETWNKDQNIMNNSLFRLQNYKIVHQDRKGKKERRRSLHICSQFVKL